MAGTLTVRITESEAEISSIKYRFIWSAWVDGRLLGIGRAFNPATAEDQAFDLVADLVPAEDVDHIEIERPNLSHPQ